VEGELALYHGKSSRAAHPDSYAHDSCAHPDDPRAHPDAYPHADDPRADPDSYPHAHPNATGCCPVRSGAVVLQHAGAELLRE
jgi:hypothetical protein